MFGSATLKDDLRSFRRSWVHHTGMQLATLSVLTATFAVVAFVLSLSMNLERVLSSWGERVELTAYLVEKADEPTVAAIRKQLEALQGVEKLTFTTRESATEKFKTQMASYAPGLLSDADFANPFPASFRVSLKGGITGERDVKVLDQVAAKIRTIDGIEDVSYGESWVKTYSSFVSVIATSGGVMVAILLMGGLFVVGNSIRASIAARREEIEILELIGATASMIRRPYVAEGAMMGAVASVFAIVLNYAIHLWQASLMSSNIALGSLAQQFTFMSPIMLLAFVLAGSVLGAIGAWLTVRQINDGWSASQRGA